MGNPRTDHFIDAYSDDPWRTVLNNILIGPEIQGWRKAARQTAWEYADLVGLRDFVDRYPHEFSGETPSRETTASLGGGR